MARDMSNVGWTILVVSSLYQLASLVTAFPTKQRIKGLCKINVGLKMNPSLPSIHQFWTFLPHLRSRLCSTQGIFQNSWRCFCLGGWLGRLGNGSICTPNILILLITNMEFEKISEKISTCLKDMMIFQVPNLQFLRFQSICRCVAVGGYTCIYIYITGTPRYDPLTFVPTDHASPWIFSEGPSHPKQTKYVFDVCLPVLTLLDSPGTPEMIFGDFSISIFPLGPFGT